MAAPSLLRRFRVWPRRAARRAAGTPPRGVRRRARATLAWVPAGVLLCIAARSVAVEVAAPEAVDPEYRHRLAVARARIAAAPGGPVGVVIGSSRVALGFLPETLPDSPGPAVCWVNAGHAAAGPVMNRLTLHRLLRDGVRPAAAVVEVMPVLLGGEKPTLARHITAPELALLRGYHDPGELEGSWLRFRAGRFRSASRLGEKALGLPPPPFRQDDEQRRFSVTPGEWHRRTATLRPPSPRFLAERPVAPGAERALRDTLGVARENGIATVLVLTPEGPAFRRWYDPAGLARAEECVASAAREFGVPVIDARDWLAEDDFFDSHHQLHPAAVRFTARLVREVETALGLAPARE